MILRLRSGRRTVTVKEIKEFMELPVKIAEMTHSPVQVPLDVFKEIMQKLEMADKEHREMIINKLMTEMNHNQHSFISICVACRGSDICKDPKKGYKKTCEKEQFDKYNK